ncbi:kinase-like domain-containing protein [Rhizophagus clarus]|uniref:Kinase-like domain-containing protein n=1 Tax=Rhizophagus clarus TaxID=94130 RepID=A0A8H3M1L9_9GLOM|nr:kinase-like domain-containing protein [Rhizophagus clarus]
MSDICLYCQQPETDFKWCQNCNSERFQHGFYKWTSGNKYIDNFIQERLRNIKYLTKGGFSTIYNAIWLDGFIKWWDNETQTWYRNFSYLNYINKNDHEIAKEENIKSPLNKNEMKGFHVVLKSLNDSSDIKDDFLNEWKINLQYINRPYHYRTSFVNIHGITQDPETSNYMIQTSKSNYQFNEIHGVIPYMAPEILRGKPYTKAADIYSFGIVMWEFTSGTLPVYARYMKKCWDSDPSKRQTVDELYQIFSCWYGYFPKQELHKKTPVSNDEMKQLPKTIRYEEKEINNETALLSESLENCIISNPEI